MAQRGGKREGAGRKKGFAAIEAEKTRELIAKEIIDDVIPMVRAQVKKAKKGDTKAFKEVMEQAFGRVPQSIDLGNKDGETFKTAVEKIIIFPNDTENGNE